MYTRIYADEIYCYKSKVIFYTYNVGLYAKMKRRRKDIKIFLKKKQDLTADFKTLWLLNDY